MKCTYLSHCNDTENNFDLEHKATLENPQDRSWDLKEISTLVVFVFAWRWGHKAGETGEDKR